MSSSWPPRDFPNLRQEDYERVSPPTNSYNCIAWAASDVTSWWWPDDPLIGYGYWPQGVIREETLQAFIDAFGTLGYSICAQSSLEAGFEKVAIYALKGIPIHAARQLVNGRWTSKLGSYEDIEHDTLGCLEGPLYGRVSVCLRRRIAVV